MLQILASTWYVIIGFCIIMYVLLDGMDLGIGILFPFFPDREDKNIMVSTILPVWDGNQTWLVLGVASLYGAFPLAFSLLLPALYLPIFIMVLALLFRGITFEFRLKAQRLATVWDKLFSLSSIVVTFTQGLLLGVFVKGFKSGHSSDTLIYDLFTPFSVTCAIALLFGYALLGAAWTIAKTNGKLQAKMFNIAWVCLIMIALFLFVISIWSPFVDITIRQIWFNPHYIYELALLPLITACLILYAAYSIYRRYEYILFWLCIGIFLCSYTGFIISTWPYIIPHLIFYWEAASSSSSLLFMLFGALLLLPVLIGYTSYSYYIFRGKVKETIGYH